MLVSILVWCSGRCCRPFTAPHSARPCLFSVADPGSVLGQWWEKVEVMLDGVSFKEILFSWSQPSAGSCPSHVHVWFVDSLALTAKTGFLTDRMRDQVAAAAQLVGAGACLDTVAEAKTKLRRRQRLDSFTLQWKTLDDKTRCSVTLSCFFVFKELLFFSGVVSRRRTSLWKTAVQRDRSPMRRPPLPPLPPPALFTFQVSPQTNVRLCLSKMLLINTDASELTFAPIYRLSLADPLRGGCGYF